MHGSAITPGSDECDAENQAQSLQEMEVAVERGKWHNCPEAGDHEIIVTKTLALQGAAGTGSPRWGRTQHPGVGDTGGFPKSASHSKC